LAEVLFGGGCSGRIDFIHAVIHQRFGDRRQRNAIRTDFGCGSSFRCRTSLAASREAAQLFREECPFDDVNATAFGKLNHRPVGDAVQEVIRCRRVNDAILDEDDIGALATLMRFAWAETLVISLPRVVRSTPRKLPGTETILVSSGAFAPCLLIVVPITFYPLTQGEIARCVGDLSGGL